MTERPDPKTDGATDGEAASPESASPEAAKPEAAASPEAASPEAAPRKGRGMTIALVAAVCLLVVSLVTYILVSQRADDVPEATPTTVAPTTVPADQLATFDDPAHGFRISYPQSWTPVEIPEGNRRLVVQETGLNAMSVSVLSTLGHSDLRHFARTTIADSSPEVEVLVEEEVSVGGAAGFYFLYTFRLDGVSEPAIHAHYFLVRAGGDEMLTIVFQAVGGEAFQRLAATFDQITESLELRAAEVAATTTTSAP